MGWTDIVEQVRAEEPCTRATGQRGGWACAARETAVPGGSPLAVDGKENGGIDVSAWERADVRVIAIVQANASTDAAAQQIVDQVHVSTADGRISATGPAGQWSVNYRISAPSGTDLSLVANNGPIVVEGIDATVRLETHNGPIAVRDVNGDLRGVTVNGPIEVTLSGAGWRGAGLDLRTTNGPISLELPRSYAAELEVHTSTGPVSLGFPVEIGRPVPLGGGGAPVRLATVAGPVSVEPR